MNKQAIIFTEIVNSAKIGAVMLSSFQRHHKGMPILVFGQQSDFDELKELSKQFKINPKYIGAVVISNDIKQSYNNGGHLGTAKIFSYMIANHRHVDFLIHLDSDIYSKKPSVNDLMEKLQNHAIVGTRRCYKNNPSKALVDPKAPDAMSTYFMGFDLNWVTNHKEDLLTKLVVGSYNPYYSSTLDFFDPLTFNIYSNGGTPHFLPNTVYGGQDENGSKVTSYKANMHFDCGDNLIHFGGVGSGLAYLNGLNRSEKSYGQWAIGRYALFAKLFYNEDIGYSEPTQYDALGRWVNGSHDKAILDLIKMEI